MAQVLEKQEMVVKGKEEGQEDHLQEGADHVRTSSSQWKQRVT
jgi:hypothetical protein